MQFTKGATTVEIDRGCLFPYRPEYSPFQAQLYTEGGDLLIQDLAAGQELTVYSFENLTTAQRNSLKSFYQNTINAGAETFTFVDVDGTEYSSARWMDSLFDFQMDTEGRWSGTITLKLA